MLLKVPTLHVVMLVVTIVVSANTHRTTTLGYVSVSAPQETNNGSTVSNASSEEQDDYYDSDDDDDLNPLPRIVGGQIALNADFPWYVQGYGCGGALIWPDVVLSAAHCAASFEYGQVLVGAVRNTHETQGSEWAKITSPLRAHPDFDWSSAKNDFMMFSIAPLTNSRLRQRLGNGSRIYVNDHPDVPRSGQQLTVMGFGYTSENGEESDRLLKTSVQYVDSTTCDASYAASDLMDFDPNVELCAGTADGSADACNGDSGSPLIQVDDSDSGNNGTSVVFVVGITSWGNGCGRPGFPGVYARISSRVTWIRETLCSLSTDPPAYCAE
jgi:secreted trypsin-like serine protease